MRTRTLLLLVALVAVALTPACNKDMSQPKRYPIEGKVTAVDAANRSLTLNHEEIPGFMKAMTMTYPVHDSWLFNVVHPGDTVQGTLVVAGDDAYLEKLSLTQMSDSADLSNTSPMKVPKPGDEVPDFHLVSQKGEPIHLAQFRGQPLLITFIYSRCPLPNYCVRMSNNFIEVEKRLRDGSPGALRKLQMLSITIDPEFDDPKVLTHYGQAYAVNVDPTLAHWTLATGKPGEILRASQFFGLAYDTKNGQIIHDLRTVLIDADGKIAELHRGNTWDPAVIASHLAMLQR
jgi:protein SCO1/2